MSLKTPYISLIWLMVRIALMNIAQSEETMIEGRPRSIAFLIPLQRARASTTRGELTPSMTRAPESGWFGDAVSILQAIPARMEEAFQAASTKQIGIEGAIGARGLLLLFATVPILLELLVLWDWSHSRAEERAFETTSIGRIVLSSKINLFLAVHRSQQIHGLTGTLMPVGGRQRAFRKIASADLMSESPTMWTGVNSGTRRQTSFA